MKTIIKMINKALVAALFLSVISLDLHAKRYFEEQSSFDQSSMVSEPEATITDVTVAIETTPGAENLTPQEKQSLLNKIWAMIKANPGKFTAGAVGLLVALALGTLVYTKGGQIQSGTVRTLLERSAEKPSKPYEQLNIEPFEEDTIPGTGIPKSMAEYY